MFSHKKDASKVALVALCRQLQQWKYTLLDCQVTNPHLVSMGSIDISRDQFNALLDNTDQPDHWQSDFTPESRW